MIDIGKIITFLLFAKCLKMYERFYFFAIAFKVCKKCQYDSKKFL